MVSKAIGGFFELETAPGRNGLHSKGLGLANGRSCFSLILQSVKPEKVYLPYYCCDTLLDPLLINNVKYSFYEIDERFEPVGLPKVHESELLLYINYFGLKRDYSRSLVDLYGNSIIIDNTHDYFETACSSGWSFNSCRKFFGVPDGAYLYSPMAIRGQFPRNTNFLTDHLLLRLDGRQQEAFEAYQRNESLQGCEPLEISMLSENLLSGIDYDFVASRRKSNFSSYHAGLAEINALCDIPPEPDSVPFCYPLLLDKSIDLSYFYKRNVFIPVLWREVLSRSVNGHHVEKSIASNLLPLPVDQRYDEEDIKFVINLIKAVK